MSGLSRSPSHPIYFGDEDQPLFGWFHPAAAIVRDIGVVLCPALGREANFAHRTLRHLAEASAAAGLPALRFDYHGTGDSAGDDFAPRRLEAWTASVHAAIDELKRRTSVRTVCLVGVRIGASLAALAASTRNDVAALACIVPVILGKAYVRELRLLSGTSSMAGSQNGDLLETGGYVLTKETQSDLAKIDLLRLPVRRGTKVLVLDRDDVPMDVRWPQTLREQGAEIDHRSMPGYISMMETAAFNVIPRTLIQEASHWVNGLAAEAAPSSSTLEQLRSLAAAAPRYAVDGVHEAAVQVRAGVILPGILSCPVQAPAPASRLGRNHIILLNAGITRRVGPSRLYIDLARRWAVQGHDVLRLDLSGIGDADTCPGQHEQTVYSGTAIDEVGHAVAFMRERMKATEDKLIIVGLCAGAYHGLKAAIAGAHVDAIVLINPLTFDWKCGDSLKSGFNDNEVVCAMSNYRRSIFSARLWQRLRDRSFSVRHALGRMRRFAALILRSKLCDISSLVGLPLPGHLGHELEQLGRRKVSLHFVFAAGEPGAKLLEIHAGHSVTRLERRGLLSRIELHDADHIFTTLDSRRRLIDTLDGLTARIQAQRMEHCLRVGHGHRC